MPSRSGREIQSTLVTFAQPVQQGAFHGAMETLRIYDQTADQWGGPDGSGNPEGARLEREFAHSIQRDMGSTFLVKANGCEILTHPDKRTRRVPIATHDA
jgi:hypothetical protein